MKKTIISTFITGAFLGIALAQSDTSTTVTVPVRPMQVKPTVINRGENIKEGQIGMQFTTGDATLDAQIKALRTEMETKIKAINDEYQAKIKALVGDKKPLPPVRPPVMNGRNQEDNKNNEDGRKMMINASGTPVKIPEGDQGNGRSQMMQQVQRVLPQTPQAQEFMGKIQGMFKGLFGGNKGQEGGQQGQ